MPGGIEIWRSVPTMRPLGPIEASYMPTSEDSGESWTIQFRPEDIPRQWPSYQEGYAIEPQAQPPSASDGPLHSCLTASYHSKFPENLCLDKNGLAPRQ